MSRLQIALGRRGQILDPAVQDEFEKLYAALQAWTGLRQGVGVWYDVPFTRLMFAADDIRNAVTVHSGRCFIRYSIVGRTINILFDVKWTSDEPAGALTIYIRDLVAVRTTSTLCTFNDGLNPYVARVTAAPVAPTGVLQVSNDLGLTFDFNDGLNPTITDEKTFSGQIVAELSNLEQ